MDEKKDILWPRGCSLLRVPTVRDARGALSIAELEGALPFVARRVFWIYDVPEGAQRGGHAHRTCHEVVFCLSGAFTMVIDDGRTRRAQRIDRADEGIVVAAGVWCELGAFAPGTVLLVFASEPYAPEGYINSYTDYLDQI